MAMSESRRKKLEMLTRSIAAGDMRGAGEVLSHVGKGAAPADMTLAGPTPATTGAPLAMETALPGREVAVGENGRYWLVRRTLGEVGSDYLDHQREYAAILKGARQRFDELEASPGLCHIANGTPEGPLFMDIESCGLAGSVIFLVGLMSYQDGQMVFEQLLARHYGEEEAILATFVERLAAASCLVTFNGKGFDMNVIRERCAFYGLEVDFMPPHCDMLHESRKLWRKSLPNCKLQTLETHLCKRRRVGDIPGAAIPEAYHRFVADSDARQLQAIVHHNLLDLLTMSQLVCAALSGEMPDPDA